MADIILNKPEAGTQAVFEAAGDSRIDLNFPTCLLYTSDAADE